MTNTAATAKAPILNPCLCSQFEIVTREWTDEQGQPHIETEGTGCTATTAREFAPGSDAKLKSLLIKAGVAGLEVRQNLGGVVHSGDALTMARQFAFAWMVEKGIERGRAKLAAQAERKAAKAERPAGRVSRKVAKPQAPAASTGEHVVAAIAAPAAEVPATVEIKVGRWQYLATIDAQGDAHYTNAKQVSAVAVKGTYKLA